MDVLGVVTELTETAASAAAAFDPHAVSPEGAGRIAALAAQAKNTLAGLEAAAAQAYANSAAWRRAGYRSAEEWLASKSGTSTGAAKKRLETAKRVEGQPAVKQARAAGRLSPEQVEKIADAVDADPSAEARLLQLATHASLRELGEECDRTRAAADPDPDATHQRIHRDRCLRFWTQAGVAQLLARCTPEQMAAIKAAVESRAEELFVAARRSGAHEPREAYLMDALEQICREWLGDTTAPAAPPAPDALTGSDTLPLPFTGAEPPTPAAPPRPAPPTPGPPPGRKPRPYLGLIRIDYETLRRGRAIGEELCEITGLGPIPVATARKLLTDAVLHLILTKGTAVGTTVNLKRGATVAQRMALLWGHPICAVTGCHHPRVEIDHVDDRAHTHTTTLDKLQPLCGHHHALKTRDAWRVVEKDSVTRMEPP